MQFKIFAAVAGFLACSQAAAVPASAEVAAKSNASMPHEDATVLTSQQVVVNIHKITVVSSSANKIITNVSPFNIFTSIPQAANDISQIVSLATSDVSTMKSENMPAFSTSGQNAVCTAFVDFVKVHQDLLRTIIGKHGLIASTGFAAPVAAGLRGIEGIVDTLAFGIISLVPTCQATATNAKNSLDKTLKSAVEIYSG